MYWGCVWAHLFDFPSQYPLCSPLITRTHDYSSARFWQWANHLTHSRSREHVRTRDGDKKKRPCMFALFSGRRVESDRFRHAQWETNSSLAKTRKPSSACLLSFSLKLWVAVSVILLSWSVNHVWLIHNPYAFLYVCSRSREGG